MLGPRALVNVMACGGQALKHSPHRLQLEASTTGFTAINLFKLLIRKGGALESDIVGVFSKSLITRG